ncbi:odorant receptor Or2-like isoform X2 [Halictus rubicundus]|uniref:odorant receptor Or2-like isoform X2 n=1 Tax=Halictus rubicundus TaxID=77578 RepID=UPI00403517C6
MASSDTIVIKDSFVYSRIPFSIGSVLPHQRNPIRFKLAISYIFFLVMMQLWDVYDNLHDLQSFFTGATEWPFVLSMLISLVLIRTNKKLIMVIKKIQKEMNGSMLFENDEEKRLYQKYNIIATSVSKFVSMTTGSTIVLYYLRPLIGLLVQPRTDAENNTRPFVLPFRCHMFFDYHYNVKLYTLIYICQLPATYASMCHAAEASLIATSTLHVCARLSMLACRIRMSLTKSPAHFRQRIRAMVIEHLELTELSGFLNDCFKNILLIEYLNCSFRLGISIYVLLITLGKDTAAFLNFCLYTVLVAAWLYLYCYIGEQLTYESLNVGDAFYDTDWTDIAARDRKSLVICILNGQQAQYLMAGKFYKFTLFGFSEIVKSSMAFFSVLRTSIE